MSNAPLEDAIRERFQRYVAIDTQSKEDSETYPSTPGQWELARLLVGELREMGAVDAEVDEFGYVLGTVPANIDKEVPTIAFISHMDTSPEAPSRGVKTVVHRNYDGGDLVLPGNPEQIILAGENPHLADKLGHDIITGDGTALMGADDKSGIAEIMTLADYLISHQEIKHGAIRVVFTPDEEIGKGVAHLDLDKVKAQVGYTLDGGNPGELECETFSADLAIVKTRGFNIHPGYAKDKMVNSMRMAAEILAQLPAELTPEKTEGLEGFLHPYVMEGSVEETTIRIIVRDFEDEGLKKKEELLQGVVDAVAARYPGGAAEVEFKYQYRNMRAFFEKDSRPVDYAREAILRSGLTPEIVALRGGTDGTALTHRGLPTPNLFTGQHNFHSLLEWISLQDMRKSVENLVHLVQIWEEKS